MTQTTPIRRQIERFERLARTAAFAGALLPLLACSSPAPRGSSPATSPQAARFEQVLNDYTERAKRLDAFYAPYFDVREDFDKFGDYLAPAYFERRTRLFRETQSALKGIAVSDLPDAQRTDYELLSEQVSKSIDLLQYPTHFLEFNQMENRVRSYLDDSSPALSGFDFTKPEQLRAFIRRSEGFLPYVDRQILTFREGLKRGYVLSCPIVRKTIDTMAEGLETRPERHPFWRPLSQLPSSLSAAERTELQAQVQAMITDRIQPGIARLTRYLKREYLPRCRSADGAGYGVGRLPGGAKWYRASARAQTDLNLSPREMHDLGLREVAKLSNEMVSAYRDLKQIPSERAVTLREVLEWLNREPTHFATSGGQVLQVFEDARAKIEREIPRFFAATPRTPYVVVESENEHDAAASYNEPTENQRKGRFRVNTKNPRVVPLFGVTTLSLHEAIPGHHFQLALQFELKNELSEFRRKLFSSTAFVEGWAHYAEFLGRDMGLYADRLQFMGHLNDAMLRAVRLVVDTGIHGLGWSRKQTLAYMRSHLASEYQAIENEADRYSVWPGQALAYKLGQLRITELREQARAELGTKYDVREYHRVALGGGTVSLGVLSARVAAWIAQTRAGR